MKISFFRVLTALLIPATFSACGDAEKVEPSTPEAMYERAMELLKPNVEGQSSDFAGAFMWLIRSAEGEYLPAQLALAGIYLAGGKGVEADPSKAREWFSRAAAQGSAEAEFYLGYLLFNGKGCPVDKSAAVSHWRRAADGGVAEAQYRLALILLENSGETAEGVRLLHKVATCEVPNLAAKAACDLGNLYAKGLYGQSVDMAKSAEWYARAARGGESRAQLVYAIMLLSGDPIPADPERGMAMLRLAAGQDNPQAIALLINLLRNGEDAAAHEEESEAWSARLESLRKK